MSPGDCTWLDEADIGHFRTPSPARVDDDALPE